MRFSQVIAQSAYQLSDLEELDYAAVARAMGCNGVLIEDPDALSGVLADALQPRPRPLVLDIVVTRDPARMLPGVDSRTVQVKNGDRLA